MLDAPVDLLQLFGFASALTDLAKAHQIVGLNLKSLPLTAVLDSLDFGLAGLCLSSRRNILVLAVGSILITISVFGFLFFISLSLWLRVPVAWNDLLPH